MKDEAWQKVNREHVWMGNYAADCMQYASPCASYADGSVAGAIQLKKLRSAMRGRSSERKMKGGGAVIKRERADGRD